jgi:hypothetical protein
VTGSGLTATYQRARAYGRFEKHAIYNVMPHVGASLRLTRSLRNWVQWLAKPASPQRRHFKVVTATLIEISIKVPCASSFIMSQYFYSPLSPGANNIRLLRLMPHAEESTKSTKLQCELFEYSLQDLGNRTHLFEALSYTWGGEGKPCSITIEEQNLAITTNLYAALLRLRDRSLERKLWIDAICINQKNPEERGQQVQLMAMIYSKACRVLVWLGETADDIEGALEDIQRAANEDPTERSSKKINEKAIFNLLQREWFQRIWVRQ